MAASIGNSIKKACHILQSGGVVAIPTETVYGLAALCTHKEAISSIYRIKSRPASHPLILHSSSLESARPWIGAIDETLNKLAQHFWPGPLTLLLPPSELLSTQITSGLPRVALRIPSHPVARQLLEALDLPLVAPSANISGQISPTSSAQVADQLRHQIPYILEGGPSSWGLESSILGREGSAIVLYRKGSITQESIEKVLKEPLHSTSLATAQAPGMQSKHYAPRIPLFLGNTEELLSVHEKKEVGLLRFSSFFEKIPSPRQRVLSAKRNLREAAFSLFSSLYELEKMKIACILAEPVPDTGLGRAINDRLKRASSV